MTNAEKYLKDENYKKTLWYDFKNWYNNTKCTCPYGIAFEMFMEEQVKPTLTEDERVILRNIGKECKTIFRNDGGLYFYTEDHKGIFPDLFQFIKERRRI